MDIQQELCLSPQLQYAILTVPISVLTFFQHEQVLKLWKNGDISTKETKKSFVRRPWADRVTQHLKVVTKLSKKKWQEIYEATQEVIASVDNDFDPEDGENSDNDDPSELVQISDESEAED